MRLSLVAATGLLGTMLLAASASAGPALEAGTAVVDITPPVGYRLSGYFYERLSTGTHDPLHAKALVLRQGETQAAMVFCDIVGVFGEMARQAREVASKRTGIPAANIAVMATHTHTGPLYFSAMRKYLHDQAVAKYGKDPQEAGDYPKLLAEKISEAIAQAQSKLQPVELRAGEARQDPQISFCRRYVMKDGTVRWNPGQQNPDIVRPASPIVPDVSMLWLYPAGGEAGNANLHNMGEQAGNGGQENRSPVATLTVFAMHADTTGGTEYSADYPYYLEQSLRRALGSELVSLFGVGTCGNINDIDVKAKDRKGAAKLGEMLAETVLSAGKSLQPVDSPALAVKSRRIEMPMQQYPPEKIRQAAADMSKIGGHEMPFAQQVETYKISDIQLRGGKSLPMEVMAFRIAPDTAIVTLPGEFFSEFGLQIKRESPFKHTLVIELTNEAPAYVPTKKAFAEGAYEVVNSRIEPGGGEKMTLAAIELLRELAK